MKRLAELQSQMQAQVLRSDPGESRAAINRTDDMSAAARLAVYTDAYRWRLIEALEANYPVLAILLGPDAFTALCIGYIEAHPSKHFSIRWFGHQLADFIAETSSTPWLVELARWEWSTAHAFDAADGTLLTRDRIEQLAPEAWPELTLKWHPSLQHVVTTTNVVALVQAAADQLPLPTLCESDRIAWCIWRKDLAVLYRSLDVIESSAITRIGDGAVFADLCEHLADSLPVDAVPHKAAALLKQWLEEQWLVIDS